MTDVFAIRVQRYDLSYRAQFVEPQAGIANGVRSLHFLLTKLRPFGVKVPDVKVEGNLTNLAEFAISCSIPSANSILRIRFETLELNSFSPPVNAPLAEIATTALSAVREIGGAAFSGIGGHEATWAAHGLLGSSSSPAEVSRFLSVFVRENPLGGVAGVIFNLPPDTVNGRISGYATVAPSTVITEGLYLQISGVYQGHLSPLDLRGRFESLIRDSVKLLHLDLVE